MECAAHPETPARGTCATCAKALCDVCASYELDDALCCEACGRREEAAAQAMGSGVLALVAVGYLATLAVGVILFDARPFVGGIAAIVALVLGRALQLLVPTPSVSRRARGAERGERSEPSGLG